MSGYKLKKDIVIPAGTPLCVAASRVERSDAFGVLATESGRPAHFVEAVLGPTAGTTCSWVMHIDDALHAGLIE